MLKRRKGVPWAQMNYHVVLYGTVRGPPGGHHQKVSSAEGLVRAPYHPCKLLVYAVLASAEHTYSAIHGPVFNLA